MNILDFVYFRKKYDKIYIFTDTDKIEYLNIDFK